MINIKENIDKINQDRANMIAHKYIEEFTEDLQNYFIQNNKLNYKQVLSFSCNRVKYIPKREERELFEKGSGYASIKDYKKAQESLEIEFKIRIPLN